MSNYVTIHGMFIRHQRGGIVIEPDVWAEDGELVIPAEHMPDKDSNTDRYYPDDPDEFDEVDVQVTEDFALANNLEYFD